MKLKLHAFPLSPRSFKVLAVANHLGLEYDLIFCDLTKGEQRRPDFGAINPKHKLPALEDGDFKLWESNAIIQYLASRKPETGLMPKDERARAVVAQWMSWESTTWDPAIAILAFERGVKGLLGLGAPDPVEIEKGTQRVQRCVRDPRWALEATQVRVRRSAHAGGLCAWIGPRDRTNGAASTRTVRRRSKGGARNSIRCRAGNQLWRCAQRRPRLLSHVSLKAV